MLLDLVFCAELLQNLVSEWSTVVRDDLFWNSVPVYDVGTDEVGDCCTGYFKGEILYDDRLK